MRPSTSEPVLPVFGERVQQARREVEWLGVEHGIGSPRACSEDPPLDQALPFRFARALGRGRKRAEPRDRHATIEDLNLASTPDLAEVAGQMRLQLGHRDGLHETSLVLGT